LNVHVLSCCVPDKLIIQETRNKKQETRLKQKDKSIEKEAILLFGQGKKINLIQCKND